MRIVGKDHDDIREKAKRELLSVQEPLNLSQSQRHFIGMDDKHMPLIRPALPVP
jgi:hypothetical protein